MRLKNTLTLPCTCSFELYALKQLKQRSEVSSFFFNELILLSQMVSVKLQ